MVAVVARGGADALLDITVPFWTTEIEDDDDGDDDDDDCGGGGGVDTTVPIYCGRIVVDLVAAIISSS